MPHVYVIAGSNGAGKTTFAQEFLWLPTVELAIKRVKDRVRQGGHDVPDADVRRRYTRGLGRFWTDYRPWVDDWIFFDNAQTPPVVIAFGTQGRWHAVQTQTWDMIRKIIDRKAT